jgi:hypothetical protein
LENCATDSNIWRRRPLSGELALSGQLRPVKGVLSIVLEAKRRNLRILIVPIHNPAEAAVVEGVDVYGVCSLSQCPISYCEVRHHHFPGKRSNSSCLQRLTELIAVLTGRAADSMFMGVGREKNSLLLWFVHASLSDRLRGRRANLEASINIVDIVIMYFG